MRIFILIIPSFVVINDRLKFSTDFILCPWLGLTVSEIYIDSLSLSLFRFTLCFTKYLRADEAMSYVHGNKGKHQTTRPFSWTYVTQVMHIWIDGVCRSVISLAFNYVDFFLICICKTLNWKNIKSSITLILKKLIIKIRPHANSFKTIKICSSNSNSSLFIIRVLWDTILSYVFFRARGAQRRVLWSKQVRQNGL
jgi:hypothetical protein